MSRVVTPNVVVQKKQPGLFERLGGKLFDAGLNYATGGISGALGIGGSGGGSQNNTSVIGGALQGMDAGSQSLGDQVAQSQEQNKLQPEENPLDKPNPFMQQSQNAMGAGSTQASAPGDPYGASPLADPISPELAAEISSFVAKNPDQAEFIEQMKKTNPQGLASLMQHMKGGM